MARTLVFQQRFDEAVEKLWEVFEGARRESWHAIAVEERSEWKQRASKVALVLLGVFLEQKVGLSCIPYSASDYCAGLSHCNRLRDTASSLLP
jgi:hypothetical protein